MPAKVKKKAPALAPVEVPTDLSAAPCVTAADRLTRIHALGRKIEEHIQAVAAIGTLPGTSAEAREKTVALFHDRLVYLERALGQTLEDLRLG